MAGVIRVRLDKRCQDAGEHLLLGRQGFRDLVRMLRVLPALGEPLSYPPGRLRTFDFVGCEIVTSRIDADEIHIVSVK